MLADLIGAEIQQHTISIGDKTKELHFRQISDAEGQVIYAPGPEGETSQQRGRRIMNALVAASVCDEHGERISDVEEVSQLPGPVVFALSAAAVKTNNIEISAPQDDDAEHGDSQPPKG